MFDKIRNSINKLLRIQRGTGNQYFTHENKGTLIETKAFLNKYVRLITGLLVVIAAVSYAFVQLAYSLIEAIIKPFSNSLQVAVGDKHINFANLIAYLIMFLIVYFISKMFVRKLTSGIEVPQEDRSRRCPMCGEQILEIAIKCKHCGSTVGRERTHTSGSSNRDSMRESLQKRELRNANTRIRPPIQHSNKEQLRGGSQYQGQNSSHEHNRRRPPSYHPVRTKDGRYRPRYEQLKNNQQRNESRQREEHAKQANVTNNQNESSGS